MREALVRIAGNLSSAKEKEWQGAIDTFLTSPLTAEAKRNVDELKEVVFTRQGSKGIHRGT